MEGRRRRAQRLTQNIQELQEREADPQEGASGQSERIQPSAGGERLRRRAASRNEAAHEAAGESVKPLQIPRMPKIDEDDQSVRVNIPGNEAGKEKNTPVRRAAEAFAKTGKDAMEGLGGLILLAIMLAGEGVRKLCSGGEKLVRTAREERNRYAAQRAAAQQEEYELEMIRPQNYHGRGQMHAHKEAVSANKPGMLQKLSEMGRKAASGFAIRDRALLLNRLLSVLLICVALYSAWQIGAIVLRSLRTNRLNESLSQQRAAIIEEQANKVEPMDEAQLPDEAGDALPVQPAAEQEALELQKQETEVVLPESATAPDIVTTTKYRQVGGDALPEMAELYAKNRDLVAWIQIPDVLDLPVVYRDNSYYLTRDFNKQKNASGTIFLDENHPFKEKTQNLLLHGHNMKDGTMFGRLAQYLYDDSYIRNHPFIYFDTLWHKEQYVIVAVLNVSLKPGDSRFFNYFTHDTFSSDREFESYIRQLQLRSYYAIPIDVNPSDALLTLSTCLDDDRLVIVARRLRENETRSELRTLIRMTTKQ